MCDNKASYPFKNYHRGLVKTQIDADTAAGALYSERVFGLGDDSEMCTPGWQLTWDEYGRVVGTAGVKSAAANGCNVGVHSAEYRMNVETATRPDINQYEIDTSFDALRLGRDIEDYGLSQQVSYANPRPKKAYVRGQSGYGNSAINRKMYN
jgi:hypothetical protein